MEAMELGSTGIALRNASFIRHRVLITITLWSSPFQQCSGKNWKLPMARFKIDLEPGRGWQGFHDANKGRDWDWGHNKGCDFVVTMPCLGALTLLLRAFDTPSKLE
jgi:hypothetical protein